MKLFSLRPQEKIKISLDIRAILSRGQRLKTPFFEVRYRRNPEGIPRMGVSVSKKSGNAVMRNLIKRNVREWFRLHKHTLEIPWDLFFIFKIPFKKTDSQDLKNALSACRNHLQ